MVVRRIVIKLVVFGLLGTVVNVGVAWGCALWLPIADLPPGGVGSHEFHRTADTTPFWWFSWVERRGACRYLSVPVMGTREGDDSVPWVAGTPPSWALSDKEHPVAIGGAYMAVDDARGWPALGLSSRSFLTKTPNMSLANPYPMVETMWGIRYADFYGIGAFGMQIKALPVRPILPGFVINTLFYAVILWLLWSAPFAARRLVRRRRGRCVRCGYDLTGIPGAGHDVCPECGRTRPHSRT